MDEPSVTCVLCGDVVTFAEAVPGPGSYPVHPSCSYEIGQTPAEGRHL